MERKMVQAIPLSIYAEYFNPFTLIIRSLPAICYKDSYMTKKLEWREKIRYSVNMNQTRDGVFEKIQI